MTSISGVELALLAVEGRQHLARASPAHHDPPARQLRQIEGVERLPHLPEDEVGDVHHVVDRSAGRSTRGAPAARPGWGRSAPRAPPGRHSAGSRRASSISTSPPPPRPSTGSALPRRCDGGRRSGVAKITAISAGQAEVVHAVGAVGGDVDVEQDVLALVVHPLDGEAGGGQPPRQLLEVGRQVDVARRASRARRASAVHLAQQPLVVVEQHADVGDAERFIATRSTPMPKANPE